MKPILTAIAFITALQVSSQNIPAADIRGPFQWKSKIYTGTERNYWIYVPKQYDASKPACLMVMQDGLRQANGWNLAAVLDTLIASHEIPVLIGIFIEPGTIASADTNFYPHYNRSFEYDALGDRYARFLTEEIIPQVKHSYNISNDPNDHSIAGASSGAICAFNAAWERPDVFRRVFSSIGTYVGLRGGNELPMLIRKTEAKPLRVFLQDGNHDNNIYAGDWWIANQDMLSALTWSGYEVEHVWGEGGHDSRHTATILAQGLRWLWKGYPAPVVNHVDLSKKQHVYPLLEGEEWKQVNIRTTVQKLAVNAKGDLFLTSGNSVFKMGNSNEAVLFTQLNGKTGGIACGADGNIYVADLTNQKIISIDSKNSKKDIVKNVHADYLIVSKKGIYFSETAKDRVGFYSFSGKNLQWVSVTAPGGLVLSSEQTFINVGVSKNIFGYTARVKADGSLDLVQPYIHYQNPYQSTDAGVGGMTCDSVNVVYAATSMGIQVSDQLGRINFILSQPGIHVSDVKFAGARMNILYACYDGKIFARKLKTQGVLSFLPPVKPPKPRL